MRYRLTIDWLTNTVNEWTLFLNYISNLLTKSQNNFKGWALLEKQPIVQLLKEFPIFYGTWNFITVFTRALHRSRFWAISIQSTLSHPISARSILMMHMITARQRLRKHVSEVTLSTTEYSSIAMQRFANTLFARQRFGFYTINTRLHNNG
jgi:hypothetical protein